jgi:Cyclin, N-terminal domain/Cyclin, C-terminal domain
MTIDIMSEQLKSTMKIVNCSPKAYPDLQDVLRIMRKQELTTYRTTDFVPHSSCTFIDPSWRGEILRWMYGVVDFCALSRESVATAAYFMDVAVAKGLIESRCNYQMVAMTALHLSLKLTDSSMVKLTSMIKLNRGLFTIEDVESMERKMLKALDWRTHPPTPSAFLSNFLLLLPNRILPETRRTIRKITELLAEIAVCQDEFRTFSASTIAFASIATAMELFDDCELPIWQRQFFMVQMAFVANMKSTSSDLRQAIEDFQPFLTEHPKLRELLLTIGDYSVRQAHSDSFEDVKLLPGHESYASPRQSATSIQALS